MIHSYFINHILHKSSCCRTDTDIPLFLDYSIMSMACEDQRISDCQTANGVEFCYCFTDLCNGIKSFQKSTVSSIGLNDDEDLTEGSGSTGTTISTLHATLQPLNTGDCLHSTFIVIAASILLP